MANAKVIANGARAITQRPFRVAIEGNIGSGKSTCIKHFERYPYVETHGEPLHEWRNLKGHNLLALMYSDIHKWSFTFQHYVHLSRLKTQISPPSNPNISVKMFERSVQNSRYCFVENAKKQNFLDGAEFSVMLSWFDHTSKNIDCSLDLIVYLKTSPEVAFDRIRKRGRPEEAEISLDYLKEVDEAYEKWLAMPDVGCEVVTIDADKGLNCVREDLERYSYKILGGNHTY